MIDEMSTTENKSVEITKGINGLDKVILREILGSSVEVFEVCECSLYVHPNKWRDCYLEEKERKYERDVEAFLKKNAKTVKKSGSGGDGAEKYVEKYRKDSEKCREDVDKSVRESLSGVFSKSKRKDVEVDNSLKSKKLKIC